MSFRLAPDDARRGGLVILGGDAELARRYAESGYETLLVEAGDDVAASIADLATPVFLFATPGAAVLAWSVGGVAAASIVGDARIASLVGQPPAVPTIVHLDPEAHAELAVAFETAQPELPVHLHPATEDGERLLLLRTLRLFSSAGGRGEV